MTSIEALESMNQRSGYTIKELYYSSYNQIENSLKALEIIKNKKVDMYMFSKSGSLNFYNKMLIKPCQLTQEEFDLLKKELEK